MKVEDFNRAASIQEKIRLLDVDRTLLKNGDTMFTFIVSRQLVGNDNFIKLKDQVIDIYNNKIKELKEEFKKL